MNIPSGYLGFKKLGADPLQSGVGFSLRHIDFSSRHVEFSSSVLTSNKGVACIAT